jgi:predicted membrane protein
MPKGIIKFDCLRCGKRYRSPSRDSGKSFTCSCGRSMIVPTWSTSSASSKTTTWDTFVSRIVYAVGGGFFGVILGFMFAQFTRGYSFFILPIAGLILGFSIGEPFINLVGQYLRKNESRD